jgi:hypothetical protein
MSRFSFPNESFGYLVLSTQQDFVKHVWGHHNSLIVLFGWERIKPTFRKMNSSKAHILDFVENDFYLFFTNKVSFFLRLHRHSQGPMTMNEGTQILSL